MEFEIGDFYLIQLIITAPENQIISQFSPILVAEENTRNAVYTFLSCFSLRMLFRTYLDV